MRHGTLDPPGFGRIQDLADELLMKGVPPALNGDMALDGHADQREITDQVENLVPHELVGPAEPVTVEHAALVHHHRIVEIAAAGETVAPEGLDLVKEAEGARPTDLALEALPAQGESISVWRPMAGWV